MEKRNKSAKVLAVLTSGRKKGFTSGLLEKAIEGIENKNVNVDFVWLPKFNIKPCIACFNCIRDDKHVCTINDDMGKKGEGELFKKVQQANAIFMADPVYFWGATAQAHLFFERLYPFLWTGALNGIPFASISCASNQGMMREATRNLCKWAFQLKMRYVGDLPVHLSYYEEAKKQAYFLGEKIALAAKDDLSERKSMTDREAFLHYSYTPWKPLEPYLDNLTLGSGSYQESMLYKAVSEKRFNNKDAHEDLLKALLALRETIYNYDLGEGKEAIDKIVDAASYWTSATWKEYLEKKIIGSKKPDSYRSLE
jgi:multimeric flavodoxin WrbA